MQVLSVTRQSGIHGLGVFAVGDIPKDTLIWQFNPIIDRIIQKNEFDSLPRHAQDFVAHYSYQIDNFYVFCGDNGRYMNHSDTPNTLGLESPDEYGITVAGRNIKAGEELTCDYREFDDDLSRKLTENEFV